ncbi:MAG: simple sugar transport system permease protein [Candidatus Atribacteria bacterium]|nr:simple sugar transport system permease protein [Candidatus Atribacteria bacterium]
MLIVPNQEEIAHHTDKVIPSKWSFEELRKVPEFGALVAFLALFIFFAISAPQFFSLHNITSLLTIIAELGIMTVGESFLIIGGEIDLSVSGVYAMAGFVFVTLANIFTSPFGSLLAFIIALLVSLLIGFINSQVVLKGGIPSFIATLGMMMFLQGILLGITGGRSISYAGDRLVPILLTGIMAYRFRPSHFWFIAIVVIFSFVLNHTVFGNRVFATGGKKLAAYTMGVNVNRVKASCFMISSALAGLSGVIAISRFNLANVSFGQGMELEAIAAAVIGGTLMTGGYGSVIGAALGAGIMGMVRTGLVMAGVPSYWYNAFVGIILVIAAIVNLKLRSTVLGE